MSTAEVFEVTNSASLGSTKFQNVMHFMYPAAGSPPVASVEALLAKIKTQFYDALSSNGPAVEWTIGSKVTRFVKENPSERTFFPVSPTYSNLATSGIMAVSQLAVCINWQSATPGRSSTGRTFYGPLKETAITAGRLTTGSLSSFSSVCQFFPPSVGALTDPWWFGVYSKKDHEFYPILAGHTDGIVDTLRSRKT